MKARAKKANEIERGPVVIPSVTPRSKQSRAHGAKKVKRPAGQVAESRAPVTARDAVEVVAPTKASRGRATPSLPDRVPGEANLEELINSRMSLAQQRQAEQRDAEKRRATPHSKRMHGVQNGNVHDANESARQIDDRYTVDRESERPTTWTRPSAFDAPPARPGMQQRWVRFRSPDGTEDTDNLDKALDQGWVPVARSRRAKVHSLTADSGGKFGQYIVKRGSILMEISAEVAQQRNRYYRQKQQRMNQGIDEDLFRLDNTRMPMLKPERFTRVSTTARRGRLDVPGDEV